MDSEAPGLDDGLIVVNGVDGSTGEYLVQPLRPRQILDLAEGGSLDDPEADVLKAIDERCKQGVYGTRPGIDPTDLAQAGWCVLFARDADPAIRDALRPLLDLRKRQATKLDERHYKEFVGSTGYLPNQSYRQFLAVNDTSPGIQSDPLCIPYYVLIVGDPDTIPYEFQAQLDVVYATGRISFDTVDEYARYAESVVAAETGSVVRPRRAAFFGVENPGDRATRLSSDLLVKPLAAHLAAHPTWQVMAFMGEQATKPQLARLLGGEETPALLFTASHGVGFPLGDPRQVPHQGALVCQEWPGPLAAGQPMSADQYLAADDVGDDANLQGLIAVHFACYGAGTPRDDAFTHGSGGVRKQIADRAFLAQLPRRLLGHPKGGALAAVGHVERAWGYSFNWPRVGQQTQVFEDFQKLLLAGQPIGAAIEYFNLRYAGLATELSEKLEKIRLREQVEDLQVANMWTANNDAKNYIIIGDPAVRLAVSNTADGQSVTAPPAISFRRPTTPEPVASPAPSADEPSQPLSALGTTRPHAASPSTLAAEVERLSARVADALNRLADPAATIQVRTFTSTDLASLSTADSPPAERAALHALSQISADGSIDTYVAEQPGSGDQRLWARHLDAVQRAYAGRVDALKTLAELLASMPTD